ncbi:hypothetical protein T440DRAFT_489477 [Plenodomus tracheiphilus IPT5]|uniref:Uncharacterized protein n=1 Tax=Plenodomus tracheiphilus IPT5 TaxID=1408161 RepID=A0A6A7B701_9PLEO|nr:hypothetical protein T440DRAFT_489477 [Plenodomus tracheiphilus IPT5]
MAQPSDVSESYTSPISGKTFQVIHLQNSILTVNVSESYDMLGNYPSFATAQRIALRALEYAAQECQKRSYRGRCFGYIDTRFRSIITVYVEGAGAEDNICLSEFQINKVYCGPAVQPSESFWNCRPEWPRTRIPMFSRREDKPFRALGGPTYEHRFSLASGPGLQNKAVHVSGGNI